MTSTINVSSKHQQGGITAGIVNIHSNPQRQLTPELEAQLIKDLSSATEITVETPLGNQEANSFAYAILNFLKSKQLPAQGVIQCIYTQPIIGMVCIVDQDTNEYRFIVGSQ